MSKKANYGRRGFIIGAIIGANVLPFWALLYGFGFIFFEAPSASGWYGDEPFVLSALMLIPGLIIGGFIGGAIGERIPSCSDATKS